MDISKIHQCSIFVAYYLSNRKIIEFCILMAQGISGRESDRFMAYCSNSFDHYHT